MNFVDALVDLEPELGDMRQEVLAGLRRNPKHIHPKFLYDARGSELFEEITRLEEYYLTAIELGIMQSFVVDMAQLVGPRARVIELGSGSGKKTRLLLETLDRPAAYLPVDISVDALRHCAMQLSDAFPTLPIIPVRADYTATVDIPAIEPDYDTTLVYFPGSTIGNFGPANARDFLGRIAQYLDASGGGGLLIGADLVKDRATLQRAYNDSKGVTAAFNLNVLSHINHALGADFDLAGFVHQAIYDEDAHCMQMRLISQRAQSAEVGGETIALDAGEAIITEYSYKWTPADFEALANQAGFEARRLWTDPRDWFGVWYLEA